MGNILIPNGRLRRPAWLRPNAKKRPRRRYVYWREPQRIFFHQQIQKHIYVIMPQTPRWKKRQGWEEINKALKARYIRTHDWRFLRDTQYKSLRLMALRAARLNIFWESDRVLLQILGSLHEDRLFRCPITEAPRDQMNMAIQG